MTSSDHNLIVVLIAHAADAWAAGNITRAEEWCRRAWGTNDDREFLDLDERAER